MLETSEVVIRYVNEKGKATSKEIVEHVGLPRSSVLREITKLADSGQLVRVGVPPKDVFYICPSKTVEVAPQTQDSTRMVTPPEQVTVAPPAPQAVPVLSQAPLPQASPAPVQETIIKEIKQSFSDTAQDMVERKLNPNWNWSLHVFIVSVMKLLETVRLRFWVLVIIVLGYLIVMVVQNFGFLFNQNELNQAKAENVNLRMGLGQQQAQQKNLEEQIKHLQQQIENRPTPIVAAALEKPVDYDALVAHPIANVNNTVNFLKGLLGSKQQTRERSKEPPLVKEKSNDTLERVAVLENQNKRLQDQLRVAHGSTEAIKQSYAQEIASQKSLVMTQKEKNEQLAQENRRLNEKYMNVQAINEDLENKLKSALAQNSKGTTERVLSVKFDENGEMIK